MPSFSNQDAWLGPACPSTVFPAHQLGQAVPQGQKVSDRVEKFSVVLLVGFIDIPTRSQLHGIVINPTNAEEVLRI